jgi:hypothetical protein
MMSLKETVTALVERSDDRISRYHRAIRLFEFEVSLFDPKAFGRLLDGRSDFNKLKRARIIATTKILERIQRDLKQGQDSGFDAIQLLAGDNDYRRIFDYFLANGGWTQILSSISATSFDDKIAEQRKKAKTAADIIDALYRFSRHRPEATSSRRVAFGVEAAKFVLEKSGDAVPGGDSTIKSRWREYRSAAVFLYLILHQSFNLIPPKVKSVDFVDKLFQQSDNNQLLRSYFTAYHTVCTSLQTLGYKNAVMLNLDFVCQPPQLNAPEFSPGMHDAFLEWHNLKGRQL